MYTSFIGKKFVTLYNMRNNSNYSAEDFFDEVFFNLFFTDNSHLMHVGNSPFFQKPKEEDIKIHGTKSLAQLANLKENIKNDVPNMSIFVGSAAKDVGGTTSGQVSDIQVNIDANEMYASWIGEALAIGVSGGYVILVDNHDLLWKVYNGWIYYRKYLSHTPKVKDKQIETWNGHWLNHILSQGFDETNPEENFTIETENVQGKIAIPTIKWSSILLSLSRNLPKSVLTIYAYNLSQTNTTLGFINLYLKEAYEMYEIRDQLLLIESETILTDKQIEQLEVFYSFKDACRLGTIGLKALEPAGLRAYMPKGSIKFAQGLDLRLNKTESYTNYTLNKIWILAMLNKTELLQLASDIALSLITFEKLSDKGKTTHSRISQEVRDCKNIKDFIENISQVLNEAPENGEIFKSSVEQVLKMPSDNFPLFITLIRFEYTYQKSKNRK